MKSSVKTIFAIAGAIGALAIGPAAAQPPGGGLTPPGETILHQYYYYGDAAHTQWIGSAYEDCNGYHPSGTTSGYVVVEEIGVCRNGVAFYW